MSQGFQQVLMVRNMNAKITFESTLDKGIMTARMVCVGIIWNVKRTVNRIFISHVTFQRGLMKIFR